MHNSLDLLRNIISRDDLISFLGIFGVVHCGIGGGCYAYQLSNQDEYQRIKMAEFTMINEDCEIDETERWKVDIVKQSYPRYVKSTYTIVILVVVCVCITFINQLLVC